MTYAELVLGIRARAGGAEVRTYGEVSDGPRTYPLIRIDTRGARRLTITTGFHGEEPAGPLTILERLPEILDLARTLGVGLAIYPCVNPTGFEDGTRYNRKGERPNNDFVRYEVRPGVTKGELSASEPYLRWSLHQRGPEETRALSAEIARDEPPHAALDIHQDDALESPLAYAYIFGDPAAYEPLMARTATLVPIARERAVDAAIRTDRSGFVVYHDGSVTDLFFRRGVPFAAAIETSTRTPLATAVEVNATWIRGFTRLVREQ